MTVDGSISAVMLPDYTAKNPYQVELLAALDRQGIDVSVAPVTWRFPILRGWLRDGRADVIHLHWITPFIGTDRWWVAWLLGLRTLLEIAIVRAFGTRVVWTVHNATAHEARTPRVDLAVRLGVARLCSGFIVHCDRGVEVVRETYRLPDHLAGRIRTIPHGHYLDSYPNETSRTTARRSLGIEPGADVLLYFGLIRPYKQVPGLIEAFRSADLGGDARLLVVGNPWNRSIRDRVVAASDDDPRIRTVLEYVPTAEIQVYMAAADAVVLPFRSVLTSGSALLAMSFSRAVIVPDEGCPADVVSPGGGITYDPSSRRGLAGALETALSPGTDLEAMGRRNRRVAAAFDWNRIAERTAAVYRGDWERTVGGSDAMRRDIEATMD